MKAILFDLDGTLWDRDRSVKELVLEQHAAFNLGDHGVSRDEYAARVLELDAHGHRDKSDVYSEVVRDFALPDSLKPQLLDHFWRAYHSFIRPFPDVAPALQALRARGVKMGIITNGTTAVQEPTVRRLGLHELMDVVLISEREGVRKPDPDIFLRALQALEIAPHEACFVGDHPETDIAAAAAVGMKPVWRRTPYWSPPADPHLEVETLHDLVSWLAAPGETGR